MLGRPMAVRVADYDTLPPGHTGLDEDHEDKVPEDIRVRDDKPTRSMFITFRHALAQITSRLVERFQDFASGRYYDTVLALDRDIVTCDEAIPSVYRLDGGKKARVTMS
jgi:hypothetical protein